MQRAAALTPESQLKRMTDNNERNQELLRQEQQKAIDKQRVDQLRAVKQLGYYIPHANKSQSSSSTVQTKESDFCCLCSSKYEYGQNWFMCEHCHFRYFCGLCKAEFCEYHEQKREKRFRAASLENKKKQEEEEEKVLQLYKIMERLKKLHLLVVQSLVQLMEAHCRL